MEMKGWIPIKLKFTREAILCRWVNIGNMRFVKPFFGDESIFDRDFLNNAKCTQSYGAIDFLIHEAKKIEEEEPIVFIFHISRCGSTLVAQMLAEDEDNIVLSENPFINELLLQQGKIKTHYPQIEFRNLLQSAIKFYGSYRFESKKKIVIKLDSWHLLFYKQIREAFPYTPFVLLYRNPKEVLISQQKERGMQAIPGVLPPFLFGLNEQDLAKYNLDQYMCHVLEVFLKKMMEVMTVDKFSTAINYSKNPKELHNKILTITKLNVDDIVMQRMIKRSMFHSKDSSKPFYEDATAIENTKELKKLEKLYVQLENVRTQHAT